MFGEEYPGDFGRWKIEAFKSILVTIDKYVLLDLYKVIDEFDMYWRFEHLNGGCPLS
jgi:hypothetical protein